MEYIVGISVFISCLLCLFPYEAFIKKHPYQKLAIKEASTQEKHKHKSFELLMSMSRKFNQVFKIQLAPKRKEKLDQRIKYAGLQTTLLPEEFVGMKYVACILTGMIFGLLMVNEFTGMNMILAVSAMVMGFFAPDNWLIMKGKNRQWAIQKEIPSVLSSMAIVTDAGFNLVQALEVVVEQNSGPLCKELKKVLEEIRIGLPVKESFIRLSQRSNVEELNYFVSAVVQGLEKGASGITKIIKEQAHESWDKRKHKAKELAEKASMKLFLPLLLLVFPSFMIYLIGPMIFSILHLFNGGF